MYGHAIILPRKRKFYTALPYSTYTLGTRGLTAQVSS